MKNYEQRVEMVLKATQEVLPAGSSVAVDGVELKQPEVVAKLQVWAEAYAKLAAAVRAQKTEQQAVKTLAPEMQAFLGNYTKVIRQVLGSRSPQLRDFGIVVKVPAVRSAAQKLLAAHKAAATRKARGTLGKKQRAQLKAEGSPGLVVYDNQGKPAMTAGQVPVVGAPVVGAPAVGAPVVGAPAVGAPAVGAPVVGAPLVGAPVVGAPVVGAPAVGVPAAVDGGHVAAVVTPAT